MRIKIVASGLWTAWNGGGHRQGMKFTSRRCLRCGRMFESAGPGNRICGCKRRDDGDIDVLGQPAVYV